MAKETNFYKIVELVEKEVRTYKKKSFVDMVIDFDGWNGIIYLALESMSSSGKLKYPITYKYRKELTQHYKKYISEKSKCWLGTKI